MNAVEPLEVAPGIAAKFFDFPKGTSVLLLPELGDWIMTSSTGRWIFGELAKSPRSVDEVVADVSHRYGLPSSVVSGPVHALVSRLLEAGLVRPAGRPSPDAVRMAEPARRLEAVYLDFNASLSSSSTRSQAPAGARGLTPEDACAVLAEARELGAFHATVRVDRAVAGGGIAAALSRAKGLGMRVSLEVGAVDDPSDFLSQVLPLLGELCFAVEDETPRAHDDRWGPGAFERMKQVLHTAKREHPGCRRTLLWVAPPGAIAMDGLSELGIRLRVDRLRLSRCRSRPGGAGELGAEALSALLRDYDELVRLIVKQYQLVGTVKKSESPIPTVDLAVDPGSALRRLGRRVACQAATEVLAVGPDGAVYPCSPLVGRCEPFGWAGREPLRAIRARMLEHPVATFHVDHDSECTSCDFKYFCGGGCRAGSESLGQHDRACALIKERCVAQLGKIFAPVKAPAAEASAPAVAPVAAASRCSGC